MKFSVVAGKDYYQFDSDQYFDISIPLSSGSSNPKCFFADDPEFQTIRQGEFVGSVADGGSVNFKKVLLTPHGNGTHTETFGHISRDKNATISQKMDSFFAIALLHTTTPIKEGNDLIINKVGFPEIDTSINALVVRTLPNSNSKITRNYSGSNPAFFSQEFMEMVVSSEIQHFLTDLPSVDKEEDGGALNCHRTFWNGPERHNCTITEMIYVPEKVKDGIYLLNLQVPNFELDAAPSRPLLFPATKV